MAINTEKIFNGTYGELWLDGEKVAEAYGLEARVELEKEEVPVCGNPGTDTKLMGYKGTGSVKLHRINSRMMLKISEDIKQGVNPRFQILSAIKANSKAPAERILIKDACFDDLSLANWEAKSKGEIEAPFTFTDWELLDTIDPE